MASDMQNEPEKRRSWTDEETVAFLQCYKNRECEMVKPRKKMIGLNNVLDDMKFMGVLQSPATALNLQSKISSLMRSYQCAIYTEATRGKGASGFRFMKLMNDIFGSQTSSLSTFEQFNPVTDSSDSSSCVRSSSSSSISSDSSTCVRNSIIIPSTSSVSSSWPTNLSVWSSSVSATSLFVAPTHTNAQLTPSKVSSSSTSIPSTCVRGPLISTISSPTSQFIPSSSAPSTCVRSSLISTISSPTSQFIPSSSAPSTCVRSSLISTISSPTSQFIPSSSAPSTFIYSSNPSIYTNDSSSANIPLNTKRATLNFNQNEPKRGNWTNQETRALINCYASREDEAQHPKKNKSLFKNILEDLVSMDVLTGPTTEANVKGKWNSLLNAYKSASDTQKRTGRACSTFMYMHLMDEIFCNRPIMANSHTVNLYGEQIQGLPIHKMHKTSTSFGKDLSDTGSEEVIGTYDQFDIQAFFRRDEENEDDLIEAINAGKLKSKEAGKLKDKKLPYSFRRTKTSKEIVQENKQQWEKLKLKTKAESRMEQLRFVEEKKQKCHEERCEVLKKILEKM